MTGKPRCWVGAGGAPAMDCGRLTFSQPYLIAFPLTGKDRLGLFDAYQHARNGAFTFLRTMAGTDNAKRQPIVGNGRPLVLHVASVTGRSSAISAVHTISTAAFRNDRFRAARTDAIKSNKPVCTDTSGYWPQSAWLGMQPSRDATVSGAPFTCSEP